MHVFLLILSIAGQPESIAAVCETYQQCSDAGAKMQTLYTTEHHKQPHDFSWRVAGAYILPDKAT
jgi:hypothetical protein